MSNFIQQITQKYQKTVLAKAAANLASEARDLLKKYFSDLGDFPVPKIEIVNNPSSKWLGRCIYNNRDRGNTKVQIQRTILADEKSRRRILAHELVHHVDFLLNWSDKDLKSYRHDGHGTFFQERAAKINAIEGENFVSKTSDEEIIQSTDKDYLLLIIPRERGLAFQWTFRPSSKQKEFIEFNIKNKNARLIKTKDLDWTHGKKIGTNAYSIPLGQEIKEKLKKLYEQASTSAATSTL